MHMRTIRSFVQRARKFTLQQQTEFMHLCAKYAMLSKLPTTNLEIGCGMGDALWELAHSYPSENFIGVEVHKPGVWALFNKLQRQPLDNIAVFCDDVNNVLANNIADHSLTRILIFFPDPWPKRRHFKRRLIQPALVQVLAKKLLPQGYIHIATDWEDYAKHIEQCFLAQGLLRYQQGIPVLPRPATKFARRGEALGYTIYDLIFSKLPKL